MMSTHQVFSDVGEDVKTRLEARPRPAKRRPGRWRRTRRLRPSWETWRRCGTGSRPPSSNAMNTSPCSSGPGPILRTMQKRIRARDLAEEQRYGHASFARELLPVLDNLQRALDAAQQQAENSPMVQGVALVRSQLLEIFGRFGITSIEALGQPFDPHLHESVSRADPGGCRMGMVVAVLQPGYRLHERVLRPAKVVVAAPAHESAFAGPQEHWMGVNFAPGRGSAAWRRRWANRGRDRLPGRAGDSLHLFNGHRPRTLHSPRPIQRSITKSPPGRPSRG